jgi:outer membrane receptor protein involved in Fe transport
MSNRKRGESRAVAVLCGISALAASAISTAQDKPADDDRNIDVVVVTGSRIVRPNVESPVPVTTITGAEIFETGSTSIGDLLNDLPALRSTFSQSNSSRFLGTTGLNLLDLRGLGTQRTLVLVNGRRHVSSDILGSAASPDINTFPADLVDRIDVVTGGSSAVYGSDAIAGVVNFVLKKDYQGLEFRGQGGDSQERDASNYYGSVLYGRNFMEDRGNIAFNLEYAEQEPFFASDRRNLARQGNFVVVDEDPPGTPNGSDGVPDRLYYDDIRFASLANGGSILFTPTVASGLAPCGRGPNLDPAGSGVFVPYGCSYIFQPDGTLALQTGERIGFAPTGNFNGGNGTTNREKNALAIYPRLKRTSFNVFGNLEISEAVRPFVEAKFVRTESMRYGGPAFFQGGTIDGLRERPRFDNPFLSDSARATIQAARAATGVAPATDSTRIILRRNLLDLGPRSEDATRDTFRIVAGLQGDIGKGWNYEVALNYGKFKEDTVVLGNLDMQRFLLAMDSTRDTGGNIVCRAQIDPAAALIYPFLDDETLANARLANDVSSCVPLNPFGEGSITPEMRNYILQDTTSVGEIEQMVASASITGDTGEWFKLPAGAIGIAAGIEHRTEENFFAAEELVASGITFYNALPELVAPKFQVSEVFAELRVPLLVDKPAFQELTLNLAGRYSEYKGETGGVFAYNAGIDWAPLDSLRFRAGLARAVRAPNIVDLYSAQGQNFALVNDPCSTQNVGTGSATRAANCQAAGLPANWFFQYASSLSFVSGGNPNLKEETSDSLTVGFVFQPSFLRGFTLSADYYDIDIDDVITAPSAQQILNACYDAPDLNNQFCGLFQRAGAGGGPQNEIPNQILEGSLQQTVLNYAMFTARGVDVEIAYQRSLESGELSTRLVWTHALQRDDFLNPAAPSDANEILNELGDPEDAFNFNMDLKRGPLLFGYQARFIGRQLLNTYEDIFPQQGDPPQNADWAYRQWYPSVWYHDVRVGYDFNDKLNGYLGIDNVQDTDPPLGLTGTGAGSGMYESRGRFFYTGFKYKF